MKKIFATTLLSLASFTTMLAQQTLTLPSFSRIVISPKIQLELVEGEQESISWEALGVPEDKVNIEVKGNKLRVYLDDAKIAIKSKEGSFEWKYPMYGKQVLVKVKVTYTDIKSLQVRGEEEVTISSDLRADRKFTLRLYGASEVEMKGIAAEKFKAVLIGENELNVKSGLTAKQKIKSIGENTVDLSDLKSYNTKASCIGEGAMYLNVKDHLRISAIGESLVRIKGSPYVSKGLVIGENSVYGY